MKKIAFIAVTGQAIERAVVLQQQFPKSLIISTITNGDDRVSKVSSIKDYLSKHFEKIDGLVFITAMGICVRTVAPFLQGKMQDPAVVCVDEQGSFVQSVLGGHQAGANALTRKIAAILGGQAVISTASDVQALWALDLLADRFEWRCEKQHVMKEFMALFVNRKPTALLTLRLQVLQY